MFPRSLLVRESRVTFLFGPQRALTPTSFDLRGMASPIHPTSNPDLFYEMVCLGARHVFILKYTYMPLYRYNIS